MREVSKRFWRQICKISHFRIPLPQDIVVLVSLRNVIEVAVTEKFLICFPRWRQDYINNWLDKLAIPQHSTRREFTVSSPVFLKNF